MRAISVRQPGHDPHRCRPVNGVHVTWTDKRGPLNGLDLPPGSAHMAAEHLEAWQPSALGLNSRLDLCPGPPHRPLVSDT